MSLELRMFPGIGLFLMSISFIFFAISPALFLWYRPTAFSTVGMDSMNFQTAMLDLGQLLANPTTLGQTPNAA
jgi:hypothetical protein